MQNVGYSEVLGKADRLTFPARRSVGFTRVIAFAMASEAGARPNEGLRLGAEPFGVCGEAQAAEVGRDCFGLDGVLGENDGGLVCETWGEKERQSRQTRIKKREAKPRKLIRNP